MPDQDVRLQLLQSWLEQCLPALFEREGWGAVPPASLTPASSDASFRRYFRWQAEGRSLILMDAPPPQEDCAPFVKIAGLLAQADVHVPQILAADLAQGFLLLPDLGRQTYLDVITAENADELLAQMPQDPQCEDIVVRAGAKDTYYYSNANMSDNYAMIAQLIEDKDLCVMFAEMVRFNARIYPSATPLKYFQRSPYGLAPEVIEQTWKAMQENPAYADIEELTNNQNERFLFSTKHLTRRYAKAISDVDEWTD